MLVPEILQKQHLREHVINNIHWLFIPLAAEFNGSEVV